MMWEPVRKLMASLTNVIRTFQSGGLSNNEFFAQIDRVLAIDKANGARLFEILSEENTKAPLPPDIYKEVRRRIEYCVDSTQRLSAEITRVQTNAIKQPPPERSVP